MLHLSTRRFCSDSRDQLTDPDEPIPLRDRTTNKRIKSELYLVETQSLDGLSGSPVYVAETMDLPFLAPTGAKPQAYVGVKLLGLYVGSWDGDPDQVIREDRRLSDG